MNKEKHLLNTKQMAEFAHNGFLRFDELIPRELCAEAIEEVKAGKVETFTGTNPTLSRKTLEEVYPAETAFGRIYRMPRVKGIMESLVGPDPWYDHFAAHLVRAHRRKGANLHQDSQIDTRPMAFDIQISIFPEDTTGEMGGTLFLPGSHFRKVHESAIQRYHNIVGQVQTVCEAGTFVVWHHNLWHAARSNHTEQDRYMFKLRLNPAVKQVLLWDTSDLDDPEAVEILGRQHRSWQGVDARLEVMQKIRFWRYLTNNPGFDLAYWLTRIENEPETIVVREALGGV